jgi:hypothetical protein
MGPPAAAGTQGTDVFLRNRRRISHARARPAAREESGNKSFVADDSILEQETGPDAR